MKKYKRFFNDNYKSFYELYDEDTFWYLSEGIINPEEYLKNIEKKVDSFYKTNKREKSFQQICDNLNLKFFFNKIKFKKQNFIKNGPEKFINFGINSAETGPDKRATIIIYLNENIMHIFKNDKFFKDFLKQLLFVIKHELIHRGQYLSIENLEIRDRLGIDLEKPFDLKTELSKKQEIMARAWESIELLRLKGLALDKIKQLILSTDKIKQMICYTLEAYHYYFDNDNKKDKDVLKLYYKYMYQYLDNQ